MEFTINSDTFKDLGSYSQIGVLVDENTLEHCYPLIENILPSNHILLKIRSGEVHKNIHTCQFIWKRLTDYGFDRKSLLINLGGGVIGDMGGFCASTFKRGMDFIQMPTTLLSQVDASTGGKLGVDFMGLKNHVGLFKEPKEVIVYPGFLKTLSKRELKSGFAEVLKHCLIADKNQWNKITTSNFEDLNWEEIIPHSLQIKKDIVAEDPFEEGRRKILNFGHTIGHAVESYFMDTAKKFLHGEAVALGMIAEGYLSYKKGKLSEHELNEIKTYLESIYGKTEISFKTAYVHLKRYIDQDKKNTNNQINCTFLEGIGDSSVDNAISFDEVKESLEFSIEKQR